MLRPRSHVLVARCDNAGDVLLAGPALRAVAAGGATVTMLTSLQGAPAARLLPGVDRVEVERLAWIDADPAPVDGPSLAAMVGRLAAIGADEAIVLTSWHQSPLPLALVLRAAGIGRITANSVDYPGSLLDVRVQADDDLHEVERAFAIVAAAGHGPVPAPGSPELRMALRRPLPAAPALPEGWLEGGYVVVHPGASVPARAWGPDAMASAVGALTAAGRRVAVTGGPGEVALTAAVAASGATSATVDLGGRTDLGSLAAVVERADAIVVGNTGPAHLAAAVGTPVVSLYAPTVPWARWRPWMVPLRTLGDAGIACAGCRARVCPVPGHPCIDTVPARSVVEAVDDLTRSLEVAR